ncbi:MAG: SDR family oxidoreductase [Desulfosarcina sp.]|jgi:NAD(P)-dependent dehydrogenase (short-subunit alcohol dehydrogenase family)
MSEKNFVIIGGTKGIGLSITKQLAAGNHHVTTVSRSAANIQQMQGVSGFVADITKDELDKSMLPDRIQGVAYCPGSIRLRPFHRLTEGDFMSDIQINLLGAIKSIQACLPGLKKAETPASVVLFSTVAVATGMPFHASVASAKGAIEGLTRSLAAEFAPKIRVNAIAPSLTDTDLAKSLLSDENKRKAAADRHPLKRVGRPTDIAAIATFLLDSASSWITGQVLSVDGGLGPLRTFK